MSEAKRVVVSCPDESALSAMLSRLAPLDSIEVLELRSNAPLSERVEIATHQPHSTRVPALGIMGGAIAAVAAYLVATLTAGAYPMITGHMPLIAAPPTGIVVFEGGALGVVLATTLAVLWECGLGPRRKSVDRTGDEEVATGHVVATLETSLEDTRLREAIGESATILG
jgi:hypothetical protein